MRLYRCQRQLLKQLLVVFLMVLLLYLLHHSFNNKVEVSIDVDFYKIFELPDEEAYQKMLAKVEETRMQFESGRKRTINTSYGPVYAKDIMFIPKNPLPRGANIYKVKASNLSSHQQKKPTNQDELDELLNQMKLSSKGKGMVSKLLDRNRLMDSWGGLAPDEPEGLNRQRRDISLSESDCTPPCMEYLSSTDLSHFKYCRKKAKLGSETEPLATTCRFREPSPDPNLASPLMALVSSPSSGVDLLRWLLQELTGLCTGSTSCNTDLRRTGYAGEYQRGSSVLLVKMQQATPFWSGVEYGNSPVVPRGFRKMEDVPVFDGAVCLMRNPFHSLVDEWHQQKHLNADLKWAGFMVEQCVAWQQAILNWLVDSRDHPVFAVQYEQLRLHTQRELTSILEFLQTPYSSAKLSLVSWVEEGREGLRVADYFSHQEAEYVNSIIRETAQSLFSHPHTKHVNITSYIHTFS